MENEHSEQMTSGQMMQKLAGVLRNIRFDSGELKDPVNRGAMNIVYLPEIEAVLEEYEQFVQDVIKWAKEAKVKEAVFTPLEPRMTETSHAMREMADTVDVKLQVTDVPQIGRFAAVEFEFTNSADGHGTRLWYLTTINGLVQLDRLIQQMFQRARSVGVME